MSKPDDHFFVVDGRRWRRTDPAVPEETAAALRSHLGRGRNAVKQAKRSGDDAALAAARHRNGLAKHGLGERGPVWWERPEADRVADAERARAELDALDDGTA
ncbi:biopolymer transporter Tol [Curtobacterium sp. VKM Ac-1395]|uniref:biopolymer transporter Tol n=1 Tax=Curtobacterium sp. VKM Ac-1395 TaxID=2783815 RepID=UPI00188AE153|nr:biopolymer transporter Tol [Curtobacterium sp. VKM Ac-1395]MBF4591044.1 biopolymer transporter Tol [Curtobacterium sp. VKM Ac-1395]